MQAKVDIDGDVSIVRLSGYLDFETVIPFAKNCLGGISTSKIIFDFEALHFVGSCGLTSFVQSLAQFMETQARRPRFAKVGIEFKKLMTTMDFLESDFYDNTQKAIESYIFSDQATSTIDQSLRLPNQWESETLFENRDGSPETPTRQEESVGPLAPTAESKD